MFFYLLYNSSLIKKKNDKEKLLYTLIYGSIIYIIFHALFSFSKTFKDLIKYLWFFFLIDCISLGLTSEFKGFSSINYISNEQPHNNVIKKVHFADDEEIKKPKSILKKVNKKEKQKIKNRFKEELKEELRNELKKEKNILNNTINNRNNRNNRNNIKDNRKNTLIQELPISNLNDEHIEYDEEEANNINLTLQNLEQLELEHENTNIGSSDIKDLKKNFLKKKMDEESDPGSDIDLEMFEQSLME